MFICPFICPFCGSRRIETIGGDYGNPFDRREEKKICMECGRTIPQQSVDVNPFDRRKEKKICMDYGRTIPQQLADVNLYVQPVIKVVAKAEGGGLTKTAESTVPFKDGTYSLGKDYPFCRLSDAAKNTCFMNSVAVKGDKITIAGETLRAAELPKTVVKRLTAYGYDNCPTEETITLTISLEIQ